ncbi:c-type cytochrome [Roseovarius salinarum]|uniref:c-type cytochrome n=1 Tax=Roseovarius salinarum TaxID=1981892 RepID=UPI000C32C1AC|nr:cytochrome c [Roseovarius salinarum]
MQRFLGAAAVMAGLVAGGAAAQDATEGQALYEEFCAACHGIEGTGEGPMSAVLMVSPTDLTALSAQNGGEFPLSRVVRRIDGRDPLVAHGSPMPVYGDFFEGEDTSLKTASGQPIMTSVPVADLVAYLETLQDQ